MFFDPTRVYNRLDAAQMGDPFKRHNKLSINTIFPQEIKHFCTCGCGQLLKGKQTRWAHEDCSKFAYDIHYILSGHLSGYQWYILRYYGHVCTLCGDTQPDGGLQIDHHIPVWAGGSLCWLSNLRPLCIPCHKQKTKDDYKLYSEDPIVIPSLFD